MKDLVFMGQNNQVLTTSLKIAEVFNKEHQHVLRDIRTLMQGMSKIGDTPFFEETTYIHEQNGQEYPMFVMNRDGFTLLAMGFTGEKALRFKLEYIKAFNMMEKECSTISFKVPTTFAEALRLAAEQAEQIEAQQKLIEVQKPKAEFYDDIVESKDALPMDRVAKTLNMGMGRNKLFAFLRDKGVLMKNNTPYQKYVDLGWFRCIETKFNKPNGDTCINIKTVVLQKGLDGIRKIIKGK